MVAAVGLTVPNAIDPSLGPVNSNARSNVWTPTLHACLRTTFLLRRSTAFLRIWTADIRCHFVNKTNVPV